MEHGDIALIITILLITLIPMLISTAINRGSYIYHLDNIINEKFTVSKWMYVANILSVLVPGVFIFISVYVTSKGGLGAFSIIFFMIGMLFLGMIIYNFYILSRMYILIQNDSITYYDGRRVKVHILLKNVKYFYCSFGYLTIDVGEKFRKVIPMYFKDSSKILAILENR
ncbi:MAG: hypothetical protein PHI90_11020 [Clostridia bacterium]|nr:hypothetical protein [Clostridia bacterium]MDD4049320.1 hypothetical protein [Clostridia bacterium]